MAGEEDVELRDLVAQTLEAKGVLGKIRAQLRASVFLALEEQESQQKPHPLASSKLLQYLKTKEGQTVTALVREFLEFFELDYTLSVFDPESNALETYPGREKLAKELGLDPQTTSSGPLLAGVLHKNTSQSPLTPATRQLNFDTSQPVNETTQIVTSGAATSALATSLPTDSTPIFTQSSTVTGGAPNLGLGTYEHEPTFQTFKLSSHTTQPNDILYKGSAVGGGGVSSISTGTSTTHSHTTSTSIGLNTNENSNLTSGGLEPRITSGPGTSTTSNGGGQPPSSSMVQTSLGTDFKHPGFSVGSLQEQGVRAELGETFIDSANSSLDMDKLLNKSGEIEKLLKPTDASELNDFFAQPLLSVPGEKGLTGMAGKLGVESRLKEHGRRRGEGDGSYEEDFHSENQISEHIEDPSNSLLSSRASDKFETEDHTLSENSAAGFDHTEHVHS